MFATWSPTGRMPSIGARKRRVVKNTGDGAIAEFASVVDAVRCADEIQRGMAEQNIDVPQDKRIELRIGIHVGDIIIEENDIFGDGKRVSSVLAATLIGCSRQPPPQAAMPGKATLAWQSKKPVPGHTRYAARLTGKAAKSTRL